MPPVRDVRLLHIDRFRDLSTDLALPPSRCPRPRHPGVVPLVTVAADSGPRFLRTADLTAAGMAWRQIRDAVAVGSLIRVRRGVFVTAECPSECVLAVRSRGLLACVSELRRRGVFVHDRQTTHIHIDEHAARLPRLPGGVHAHRGRLHRTPHPRSMSVEPFDAIVCAVRCQDPRSAVATLDSALHLRLLRTHDLDELFDALPRRYARLRGLLEPRAEAGTETLVRLMLRGLGCRIEVQVDIDGVGRVDHLVDGWLIVECDSRAHHSTPEAQLIDRRRDLAAARLGYVVVRLLAEDILWQPEKVVAALRGILTNRGRRR